MATTLRTLTSSRSFAVTQAIRVAGAASQAPLQWRRRYQTTPASAGGIPDYAFAFEYGPVKLLLEQTPAKA